MTGETCIPIGVTLPMRKHLLLTIALCGVAIATQMQALRPLLLEVRNSTENERVAASLAEGRGFSDAFAAGTGPTAHVAPLYPLLLSGVYRACDCCDTASRRLAQMILSFAVATIALVLLPRLGRRLRFSATAAWTAAFGVALLPHHLWTEVTGSHEQALAVPALLGLVAALASLQRHGWSGSRPILTAGVAVGVTALLCPNLLLIPILFMLAEGACRATEWKRILVAGLGMFAVTLILITPWVVRNYIVLGGFVPLRSNLGMELAVGNRPGANGHTYCSGFDAIHPFASAAERRRLAKLGELAYMQEKQQQALGWIADHPMNFAWLTMRRAWLFWFGVHERWCRLEGPVLIRTRLAAVMGLTVIVALLVRRRRPETRLLTCALLGAGLPYFLTHVEARYRLPVVGLFALLSCELALAAARWTATTALLARAEARRM